MTGPLICLAAYISAQPAAVALTFGEPTVTASSLTLAVRGGEQVLAHTERHVSNGRLVLYLPGSRAAAATFTPAQGPAARVDVKPVRRGVVIVVRPRGRVDDVARSLVLVTTPPARIELGAPPPPIVDRPRPTPAGPMRAPSAARPRAAAESPVRLRTVGASLGLAAAAAAFAYLSRRRRKRSAGEAETIDVVAVRPLGPKHRLALIDACGDRLLVATSEGGVRLLSRVGEPAPQPSEFAGALSRESELLRGSTAISDISGLLRLRAHFARGKSDAAAVCPEAVA